jgi:ketosteroid isomerase-like protein
VFMAQDDNATLIRGLYDAFGRGDIQHILDRITDDVDWVNEGPETIPYAGTYKGRAEVPRFFQALGSTTEGGRVTADEVIGQGDKVFTLGRFTATVKATGKRIDVPIAHLFTVRSGKVSRWVGLTDTARVAEAYSASASRAAS